MSLYTYVCVCCTPSHTHTFMQVSGNTLVGSVKGGISDSGSGTKKVVENNVAN